MWVEITFKMTGPLESLPDGVIKEILDFSEFEAVRQLSFTCTKFHCVGGAIDLKSKFVDFCGRAIEK